MAKKEEWNEITALTAAIAIPANNISAANVAGTEYTIVDKTAREVALDNRYRIDDIKDVIAGGVNFRGKTAVAIADGAATTSIAMAGGDTLVVEVGKAGDMVIVPSTITGKEDREFIWDGAKWNEFGNASNLKAFAFADTGTATFIPSISGAINQASEYAATLDATFTGTAATLTSTVTVDSYTPEGTISCGDYTPSGSVTVDDIVVGDKKISVKEISSQSFTGTAVTATVNTTTQSFDLPTGIVFNQVTGVDGAFTGTAATINTVLTASSGSVESTGKLSKLPELSTSGKVNAVTNVTTSAAAAGSASVLAGVLSFDFANVLTAASVTTADVSLSVESKYKSTLTSVADLDLTVTGTAITAVTPGSTSYTPEGSVAVETFEPTGSLSTTATTLTATGSTGNIVAEGTVALETKDVEKTVAIGTLKPTASFTGTKATLTAKFTGTAKAPTAQSISISYTPEGTVSGTAAIAAHTHTHTIGGVQQTITVTPAS